jgi:hypothetical protein
MGKKRAAHAEIRKKSRTPSVCAQAAKPRLRAAFLEERGLKKRAGEKTPEARKNFCSVKLMEGSKVIRPRPAVEARHDNTENENNYYYLYIILDGKRSDSGDRRQSGLRPL